MGWFWSDAPPKTPALIIKDAPHPPPSAGAVPPPACPMHIQSEDRVAFPPRQTSTPPQSSCPVKSPAQSERYPSSQPEPHSSSTLSKLNPLNYMPVSSNTPDANQDYILPLEKETSSIPRGDSESNWEYPSPQQMYNAMLRKQQPGQQDIDVTAVESMVAVHNFLNEGAWDEIVTWESLFSQGLKKGFERCSGGEEGIMKEKARQEFMKARREALGLKSSTSPSSSPSRSPGPNDIDTIPEPRLLRFQGRPNEPTPKSRILRSLATVFPNTFDSSKPFDRHDWYVARRAPDGSTKEVRYVIDYYGGGLQATGEPVFYLDIRPALDGPTGAAERLIRWGSDVWWRASGGSVREAEQEARKAATATTRRS